MRYRKLVMAITGSAVLAATAACGSADQSTLEGKADDGALTIGIRYDLPGMSQRRIDGEFVGFDVDVAKYVAAQFDVQPSGITWREVRPADREKLIASGEVDLVVANYSITEPRKQQVGFAGPYFQTGQGLLVRATEEAITGTDALSGKKLCSVTGTTSAAKVKEEFAQDVELVEYGQYSDCVTALLAEKVDAVTTDEAILTGFVGQNPELLKLAGEPFTTERYGIGLAKDDAAGRGKVASAIEKMVSTGEWKAALDRNLGSAEITLPEPPAVTEK